LTNNNLDHFLEEVIDLVLSVAKVSTLNKVVGLLSPSTSWVVELEWPQEVRGILEVGSNSQDLVDQVFNADDSKFTKRLLNDLVGSDWGSVSVNLDKSTLVDKITNSLEVGTSVGDVWLSFQDRGPSGRFGCGRNGCEQLQPCCITKSSGQ